MRRITVWFMDRTDDADGIEESMVLEAENIVVEANGADVAFKICKGFDTVPEHEHVGHNHPFAHLMSSPYRDGGTDEPQDVKMVQVPHVSEVYFFAAGSITRFHAENDVPDPQPLVVVPAQTDKPNDNATTVYLGPSNDLPSHVSDDDDYERF